MDLNYLGWKPYFSNQLTGDNDNTGIPGRIITVQKGHYLILSELGDVWGKLSGAFLYKTKQAIDLPTVGDWVLFTRENADSVAMIQRSLKRQNYISRLSSGQRRSDSINAVEKQIIAANIDLVFIVSGLDRDYNIRRIERYLTMVYDSGATPAIILNKADLCDHLEEVRQEVEEVAIGVPVHTICTDSASDMALFHSYLTPGKTAALIGSSGVGKSTIINKLLGHNRQQVKSVSSHVGKGTHTTTTRELIQLPNGAMIIDNPGLRELQLASGNESLSKTFQDLELLAEDCRFGDCGHINEPGCAIKQALENGTIDQNRYRNYLKMKKEMVFLATRESKGLKHWEREKTKEIRLMQKEYEKFKRQKARSDY